MVALWLRVRAPFAAFRWFQAGVYRATAPIMPPSSAYGLLLNLAAFEMRDTRRGEETTTLIRANLPVLQLAIGVVTPPERGALYQQLHTYPVGNSGKEFEARTHGAKYWITPARREILIGFDCVIGAQTEDSMLFDRIRQGLKGDLDAPRYGLPFAGDNNFLIDRIDELSIPPATSVWYARMQPNDAPRKGSCRLTVGIDRADNSKTTSLLYAPVENSSSEPPELAWTWTPREPTPLSFSEGD